MIEEIRNDIEKDISKSKKYLKSIIFDRQNINLIYFRPSEDLYTIEITELNKKIYFTCLTQFEDMKTISVEFSRESMLSTILSKFKLIIKNIKKTDIFITKKQEHYNILLPIIINFIKTEYNIELNFTEDKNFLKLNFKKTEFYSNRKYRFTYFDVSKENISDISYNGYINISHENINYSLTFDYSISMNKLILHQKIECYDHKDISKIIRSEKIKNLMSKNYDSI